MAQGRFFTISAPSGTGKTTIIQKVLPSFPDIKESISCTTRAPRPGERDGVDYYFVDEKTFEDMVTRGELFEWAKVHGAYYGTPKTPLLKRRQEGKDTFLDVDTQGAFNLKRAYPDTCALFLMPPSLEDLEKRLRSRKTESEKSLRIRLENARREIGEKDQFDYVIINDSVDRAVGEITRILKRESGGNDSS